MAQTDLVLFMGNWPMPLMPIIHVATACRICAQSSSCAYTLQYTLIRSHVQGAMRNHAFLGALAAVASNQDLLLDLIVSDDHAASGVYAFQVYKHGCWHRVFVDNYLPCIEGEDRLAFACRYDTLLMPCKMLVLYDMNPCTATNLQYDTCHVNICLLCFQWPCWGVVAKLDRESLC